MSLTLMRPFAEMNEMFKNFDHSLGEFEQSDWMPAIDIEENNKSYLIKAELPGVHKNDVHVHVDKNVLTIKGEKKDEKKVEIKDTKRHRVERTYGSFVRSFTLPHTVKTDNIDAKFANGILSLTIEKAAEVKHKLTEVKIK